MAPNNPLSCYGNEKTMNLNHMILTNIQASPYFKVNLYELKTYHEVIDEIYYKVDHLEPWEKGSRKTAGQTGMCGGVRGVGAGGIVSSAYCLLYKLFTLKLTHKQVMGLINHTDSPYIRGLGFMFVRYTQPPADLWEWFEDYLDDEEEVDVRAGGGQTMTMGEMVRLFLTKLEWFSTLFPRIPVPIQKQIHSKLKEFNAEKVQEAATDSRGDAYIPAAAPYHRDSPTLDAPARPSPDISQERRDRRSRSRERHHRSRSREHKSRKHRSKSRERRRSRSKERRPRSRSRERRHKSRSRERRHRSRSRDRKHRSRSRDRKHRSRSRDRKRRSRSRDRKHRSRSRDRKHRSRSRDRKKHDRHSERESSFERDLKREKDRIHKERNGK